MVGDGLQAGEDQQGRVAHVPPHVDEGDSRNGPLIAAEEGDAGQAHPVDDLVHDAQLVVQHPEPEQRDDHVSHEERQQQDAADEGGLGHAVHEERESDGDDGLETDVQCNVLDGDGHRVPEQVVAEDRRVVLQADPGGITQDAVLGEAEVDAPDGGDEEEKNKADHRREDEEQRDLQVTDPADAEPFWFARLGKRGGLRLFGKVVIFDPFLTVMWVTTDGNLHE